ncbi:hypothetical protein ACFZAV_26840, partial [Streptomyces sp. NPDC008343]
RLRARRGGRRVRPGPAPGGTASLTGGLSSWPYPRGPPSGEARLWRPSSASTITGLGVAPLTFPLTGAAIGLWGTGPVFVASAAVCGLGGAVGVCARGLRRAELPR